ncbi:hypothetical protein [Streptomyces sp. AC495_CC817]|uniref:hypothetical protein n=1 Tax=Streptomyces sp. AC495_CC817 TaxID=2823900 RepID=UPI001C257315|nr:hypothetical protein [Streptomyces sp. AC495_CC817]
MLMTEPQIWTLIAVFSASMIGVVTLSITSFGRVLRVEIGRIDDNLGHLNEKIGAIDTKIGHLDTKIDGLEARLNVRLDALDRRVDELDKEVANLATRFWRGSP